MSDHLSTCPACRKELKEQGALDMLLKKCFTPQPTTGYFNSFWPTLAEGLDESPAGGDNGASESAWSGGGDPPTGDSIVFQSSAAMKILDIPEPVEPVKPVRPVVSEGAVEAPEAAAPAATPWRWPVAMMVSAAIVVVGFLAYQKMTPPPQEQPPVLASAGIPGGEEVGTTPLDEPAGTPQEGAADDPEPPPEPAPADPGQAPAPKPAEEGQPPASETKADTKAGKAAAPARARKRKGKKSAASAAPASETPAAKPEPAAKPKKKKARKSSKGGADLLDSLIDDAIGKQVAAPAAKPRKAKAAAKPAKDPTMPDQLSMNQIRKSMNKIKGLVVSCYDKFQVEGRANVKLTISNDGAVTDAVVKGKFFGTDTGACVIKAVKKAKFSKYSGKTMTIRYPFILQ